MEGSGGAEQDIVPPPGPHPIQKVPGEHRGAAPAAGAAAVDVLVLGVENEGAAVHMVGEGVSLPLQQLHQQLAAQAAQVPGDDQVVEVGGASGVPQVGGDGVHRRRGRSQGCTMWKMFSVKFNAYSSPEARRF